MSGGAAIVAEARRYIGTPWVHRGRRPGLALDCAGVPICAGIACGHFPAGFDVPEYSTFPDGDLMLEWCRQYMGAGVSKDDLRDGDLVVMITDRDPQHLGIVGTHRQGGRSIIHASNARSVIPARVLETRLLFSRSQRFVAAFRFPGVTD